MAPAAMVPAAMAPAAVGLAAMARVIVCEKVNRDERGSIGLGNVGEPLTPLIEGSLGIDFEFAELGDGQLGIIESVDSFSPLLGKSRVRES